MINVTRLKKITKHEVTYDCESCGLEKKSRWVFDKTHKKKCKNCHTMNNITVYQGARHRIKDIKHGFSCRKDEKELCRKLIAEYKQKRNDEEYDEDDEDYDYLINEQEETLKDIEQFRLGDYEHNIMLLDEMIHKNYTNVPVRINVKASRVTIDQMFYKCPYCNREHIHGIWELGENSRVSHCILSLPNDQWSPSIKITIDENTPGYSS